MTNYPIWISTDAQGTPMVGAHMMDDLTVASEQIFPSQMRYRCTARSLDNEIHICTRTTARDEGWDVIAEFPAAYGPMGRGR